MHDPAVLLKCFGVDEDVVKVYAHYTLHNEVQKDVVHHGLEGGQAIGESKEHDEWFKQSPVMDAMEFLFQLFFRSPTAVLIILIEGLSMGKCQGWRVQEVEVHKEEVACMASLDGHVLLRSGLVLFLDFSCTGETPLEALAHRYLALGPVYFQVVLLEPSEAKDLVLLA
ncbi:hypothetical protein C0993_012664 [Termitomyces sp. T159_Od127]|nr:hypothetical protein C0993_012664 [Termitomyces sp. T159_Od127]